MWWLEFWKVIGRIISSSAKTWSERLSDSAETRKRVVNIHGPKKGINCGIHYTASTAARTVKVTLLIWITFYKKKWYFKPQNVKIQIHTCNLWWLSCISVHLYIDIYIYICLLTACVGLCICGTSVSIHSSHWPISLLKLQATHHLDVPPHMAALTFDREDLQIIYSADGELVSKLICPEAETDAVHDLRGLIQTRSFNRTSPGCVTARLKITNVV